jgi:hypothetical protein
MPGYGTARRCRGRRALVFFGGRFRRLADQPGTGWLSVDRRVLTVAACAIALSVNWRTVFLLAAGIGTALS